MGVAFGLAFQRAFMFRRAVPARLCKASAALPVNLGRIGVFVARERKSVTLFSFSSSSEKIPPDVKSDVSQLQRNISS